MEEGGEGGVISERDFIQMAETFLFRWKSLKMFNSGASRS